jgi:hypothetical protein
MPMEIDLKTPGALTVENVRQLIASKDDKKNRQLRVTKRGVAFLSDEVGLDNLDGILFRLETWCAGNGYCGPEAARDRRHVQFVYQDLRDNWPKPKANLIDF